MPPHKRRTHHVPLTWKVLFLSNNHTPPLALAPSHLTHTIACTTTTINQSPRHLLECLPSTETYVSCLWKSKGPRAHTTAKVVGGYANREHNSHIIEHARYFVTSPSARRHPRACPPSLFGPVHPTWLRSSADGHRSSTFVFGAHEWRQEENQKHCTPTLVCGVTSTMAASHPSMACDGRQKFDGPAQATLFTPCQYVLLVRTSLSC